MGTTALVCCEEYTHTQTQQMLDRLSVQVAHGDATKMLDVFTIFNAFIQSTTQRVLTYFAILRSSKQLKVLICSFCTYIKILLICLELNKCRATVFKT